MFSSFLCWFVGGFEFACVVCHEIRCREGGNRLRHRRERNACVIYHCLLEPESLDKEVGGVSVRCGFGCELTRHMWSVCNVVCRGHNYICICGWCSLMVHRRASACCAFWLAVCTLPCACGWMNLSGLLRVCVAVGPRSGAWMLRVAGDMCIRRAGSNWAQTCVVSTAIRRCTKGLWSRTGKPNRRKVGNGLWQQSLIWKTY